jgi:two-component system, NtrC family, sensor histidine kinase KinB
MIGLRQKLLMGFGGLLLILLLVSGMGIAVMHQHHAQLKQFLLENWRSVGYGQNMVDALAQLDDIAKPLAPDRGEPTKAAIDAAAKASVQPMAVFEQNLHDEDANLTLPGEDRLATELTLRWLGKDHDGQKTANENYSDAYAALLKPDATPGERAAAYAAIQRLSPLIRSSAKDIIKLNFDNMNPLAARAQALTDSMQRAMLILSAVGVALAILFTMIVSRSMLEPVKALTKSAREIEQGNLDLVVQVKSRDELRQLAEAFNSMAAKLREYRRTNRAKLVRTQETTQNAINSLPDAVAILSPDGNVDMANTAAQRLFDLRPGEHVSALRAQWLRELYSRVSTELRPIEPRGYESAIQVMDEGGGERFFLPHAVPILDDGDRTLLGVTVVLADVTNLRRLDEMKSGMLSVVSHELRTPLTSIRMGVHLLLEERLAALTPQQNDILVAMREDSDRLNTIVENLLDMGRIEAGRALMDLKPEPAERVVSEATEAMTAAYHDKGVELIVDVPGDIPPVLVDHTRIGHVFSNLLTNALKYTPPGGQVKVAASAEDGGEFVRFSVQDSGAGIPRQYLERIFERFFRVPGQTGGTGAGLGLAITKEIVEAHGGRVAVESSPGKGSTFSFTLQRGDTHAPADVASAATNESSADSSELVRS